MSDFDFTLVQQQFPFSDRLLLSYSKVEGLRPSTRHMRLMFGLLRSPNQPQLPPTSYVILPWLFGTCISDYSNNFFVKSFLAVIGNFYVKSIQTLPYFCVKQPMRRTLKTLPLAHFFRETTTNTKSLKVAIS